MPQPDPIPNDSIDIQTLVIQDIEARREHGIKTYGTALQANNGRDALQDAYEEALDLCMYLRQMIEERGIEITKRPTIEDIRILIEEVSGQYKLPQLNRVLVEQTGLDLTTVKDAIWELLDQREIKFDRHWYVVLA